jgi:hypothetical protein
MPLSRRQFFRSFWSPQKTLAQRQEQYRIMKSYVGAILIPFDFSLTPEQTTEVFAIADTALQAATDEELFSDAIRIRLDQLIEPNIKLWYNELLSHVEEVRQCAPDYVTTFLREGSTEEVEQLMKRFSITDWDALDTELRKQVRTWIAGLDNEKVRQYDVLTVKDLVFTEIRSWC